MEREKRKDYLRYFLIIVVFALVSGVMAVTGITNWFYISAFTSEGECTAYLLGHGDTIADLNWRLIYAALGNLALLALIFITLTLSLRMITAKHRLLSMAACALAAIFLSVTIYDGHVVATDSIARCTQQTPFQIRPSN